MARPEPGIARTPRMTIRQFRLEDAPFLFELLNDADFIRYIGDRGVRTLDDARRYIEERAFASYRAGGYGPFLAELRENGRAIGLCSLLKRETLEDVDLGFAFLPGYRSRGFAYEASEAMLEYARGLGLTRIIAIASAANSRSLQLLERLGFRYESRKRMPGDADDVCIYGRSLLP